MVPPISSLETNPRAKRLSSLGFQVIKEGVQRLDAFLLRAFLAKQIKPVSVYNLGPSGNEVAHEALLVIVLRVNLDVGTKD